MTVIVAEVAAAVATAVVAVITFLFALYKWRTNKKRIRHALGSNLKSAHNKFIYNRNIVMRIFKTEDQNESIRVARENAESHGNKLSIKNDNLERARKYLEEKGESYLKIDEMDAVRDYISCIDIFYRLISVMLEVAENKENKKDKDENKEKTVIQYKRDVKSGIDDESCRILNLDRNDLFDTIMNNYLKKIDDLWERVEAIPGLVPAD